MQNNIPIATALGHATIRYLSLRFISASEIRNYGDLLDWEDW